MFNYFFGGAPKKDNTKKAIVDLREHILMLTKRQAHLELQIEEQAALARKHVATNKTAAKQALKKKKTLETLAERLNAQIETMETQLSAIELANLNLETMKAMQGAATTMKKIHKDFDVDKVDETMDEVREQVETANEISEAISRNVGTEVDEDDLEDELAALEDEVAVKTPAVADTPMPVLPTVPQKLAVVDDDEAALKALQEEMGL